MIDRVFGMIGSLVLLIFIMIQALVSLTLAVIVVITGFADWYVVSKLWNGYPHPLMPNTELFGLNIMSAGIVALVITIFKHLTIRADQEIDQFGYDEITE